MELSTIDDLEFFEQLARSETLTEAARYWGRSVSAVSRRLAKLEARLGVPLIRRSTRRLVLTEEGRRYATGASVILRQRTELEDALCDRRRELKGRLRVHSTPGIGRLHIAPLLAGFAAQHPQTQLDLELSPLPLNIAGASFDIAIRVGRLPDSRLRATRLAKNRRVVCGAPSYLDHAPPLRTIRDLEAHNCIVIRENNSDYSLWRFGNSGQDYVEVRGSLISDDGEVATEWCVQGSGLIMRSTWHAGPLLANGQLRQVLTDISTPDADIFALFRSDSQMPRRVAVLLEYLRHALPERLGQ